MLKVGDKFTFQSRMDAEKVQLFADVSGDHNPLHLDAEFAAKSMFKRRVVHGMLTASLVSAALASMPGTVVLTRVSFDFVKPVFIDDELTACVTVVKDEGNKLTLDAEVSNKLGMVLKGFAVVLRRTETSERVGACSKISEGAQKADAQ